MKNALKNKMPRWGLLFLASVTATSAWARHGKPLVAPWPCDGVMQDCVKAGEQGDDAKACVKTIRNGGTVGGVTATDYDLKTCRDSAKTQGVATPSAP